MYCGDETGSFIGEIASSSCRFGYGGEDCPKSVLSSYMCQNGTIPISAHHSPKDDQDIVPIFNNSSHSHNNNHNHSSTNPNDYLNNGIIENYDAWENAWQTGFEHLHVGTLNKHTQGGKRIATPRVHSSGLTSSTIPKQAEAGVVMHPILAIDHGNTHCHDNGPASANPTGTGQRYNNSIIQNQKSKMIEILYESLSAPAAFIAPAPMLASFANGRQTSLVVDVGAGGTRVTPIVDGLVLTQAQRRNGRGGDWLGAVQDRAVRDMMNKNENNKEGKEIVPRYALTATRSSPVEEKWRKSRFHQVAMRYLMYEMKTAPHVTGVAFYRNDEWTIPFLSEKEGSTDTGSPSESGVDSTEKMDVDQESSNEEPKDDGDDSSDEDESYDLKCKKCYKLPDGTRINLQKSKQGQDLCRLNELLFASELPFPNNDQDGNSDSNSLSKTAPTLSNLPIHELIKESLSAVPDADVRKELCGNIILTGAASLVPNIEKRLSLEVQYLVPSMYKCKVIATKNTIERRYAAFIGGSVLSSLGSFQQLWLSKKEYEEYGMTLATQRFP